MDVDGNVLNVYLIEFWILYIEISSDKMSMIANFKKILESIKNLEPLKGVRFIVEIDPDKTSSYYW